MRHKFKKIFRKNTKNGTKNTKIEHKMNETKTEINKK